jgi:protein SCO1/2
VEQANPKPTLKINWFVWPALLLTVLVVGVAFVRSQIEQGQMPDLRPIAQVPEFALTNQDSRAVSLADLRGNVWAADVIFTRCAGPCPRMTQRMSELQKVLSAQDKVKLVTLTTDPAFDRPEVLKRYAERFKADSQRWMFLTGTKQEITRVAVDGLKLAAMEKDSEKRETPLDLFIHSELIVFVDKQGRLRGSVESDDPKLKSKVLAAVKQLLREKD